MNVKLLLLLFLPIVVNAQGSDYWNTDKTMNLPQGVATTTCDYFNSLESNQSAEVTRLTNELYARWLKGWVSSFAMYSDWNIRAIGENEYIEFLQGYCENFPKNIIGMAAHAFTFRVKE